VGVAPNMFLAKLASSMNKPDALTIIDPRRVRETLDPLPIGAMWGVGPVTEQRLRAMGIERFADVHSLPIDQLERELGAYAHRLRQLALGEDDRPVTPDGQAKSISHEQTFGEDLAEPHAVRDVLLQQTEAVAWRLRKHSLRARSVTVKIRFGDYHTITRSATLDEPTDRTDLLWRGAAAVFDAWVRQGFRPVRLIGMGAGLLGRAPAQMSLFTQAGDARRANADRAADLIQAKFGRQAIHRGPPRSDANTRRVAGAITRRPRHTPGLEETDD
jgi:DNA polymerase-4